MVIKEFGALNFRNYRECFVTFNQGINIFIGNNGQGKTNLAEGIYFICHLSSFRTPRLDHLITFGEGQGFVQGVVEKREITSKAKIELNRNGRRVWLDNQPVSAMSAYISLFHALLFNPDSLYNYRNHPAERRLLFDRLLSFYDQEYLQVIKEYRRVHLQKNRLLKSGNLTSLPDWNQLFIDRAHVIIRKRREMVENITPALAESFGALSGRAETLRLDYLPSLKGDPSGDAEILTRAKESEAQAGYALYGPHRDDFRMALGGTTAGNDRGHDPRPQGRNESFFSQGEYRIAHLALKLALNDMLGDRMGFHPALILDDLYSELDPEVAGRLTGHLKELPNQIFITTTQTPKKLELPGDHIMEIRDGRIH